MKLHFDDELKELKNLLLKMGILVEQMIDQAITALLERKSALAFEIVKADKKIDRIEIEVDEMAHNLMARRQPIAHDLRLITMILKINSTLERVGDHAVNIAEKSVMITAGTEVHLEKLERMAAVSKEMLRDSLNAFMEDNAELAKSVLVRDDEVDELNKDLYEILQEKMKENSKEVSSDVHLIMIAHNFERIADLATNIAEDVIYVIEGRDVRHHFGETV